MLGSLRLSELVHRTWCLRPSPQSRRLVECPEGFCQIGVALLPPAAAHRARVRRFQCRTCRRRFNERTGTRFNEIRFPSDVVMLAVLWRLRYKLSLRDVAEMLLERGYQVTHETVRTWEASFAPLLSERLRAKRRGRIGSSWR